MQNDQKYSDILDLVQTKEDFTLINNELDLIENSLYEVRENYFDTLVSSSIRKETANLFIKLSLSVDKKEVLERLRAELGKIKFMEITLAYDPSVREVEDILKSVNFNNTQRIAIDMKVNKAIIGGALIVFEGKFYDGSLSTKLEAVLKNYV